MMYESKSKSRTKRKKVTQNVHGTERYKSEVIYYEIISEVAPFLSS